MDHHKLLINGEDDVVLFGNGVVVDFFGIEATMGTVNTWDYKDGWTYHKSGMVALESFTATDWYFLELMPVMVKPQIQQ